MPRALAPLVLLLTTIALPRPVVGQAKPDRCANLRDVIEELVESHRRLEAAHAQYLAAIQGARTGLREANDRAVVYSRQDLFRDLLEPDAETERMRQFSGTYALSPEVTANISAGKPYFFWNGAGNQLTQRLTSLTSDASGVSAAIEENQREEYAQRQAYQSECGPVPQPGPAPIERVRNIPVLTDDVITRWLRAWRAKDQNGGAYWQAGQMTQLDYQDIKAKVERWIIYCGDGNRRPEEDITESECAVLRTRRPDILNAQAGKWSEVHM